MPILEQEPSVFPTDLLTSAGRSLQPEPEQEFMDEAAQRIWWVIYTRSRQEKALARQLYGYQIPFYLPLVARDHVFRGRKMRSFLPLFSGYLFFFGSEDERVTALTTNRISRILPVRDPERLREDLLQVHQLIEAGAPLTVEQRLQPGHAVRIKNGAMKGIEGTVIQRRGKDRLLVAVDYLQQGVSIAIEDFMVEPVY